MRPLTNLASEFGYVACLKTRRHDANLSHRPLGTYSDGHAYDLMARAWEWAVSSKHRTEAVTLGLTTYNL